MRMEFFPRTIVSFFLLLGMLLSACGKNEEGEEEEDHRLEVQVIYRDQERGKISAETREGREKLEKVAYWKVFVSQQPCSTLVKGYPMDVNRMNQWDDDRLILINLPYARRLFLEISARDGNHKELFSGNKEFDFYDGRQRIEVEILEKG